jgi:Ca-activated chloride channel family protein
MKRVLACLAGAVLLASASAASADRAIIVLDASGSMWGQIDGEAKISIARQTLSDVLKSVPQPELGLIAYGHREGQLLDIELKPPQQHRRCDRHRRVKISKSVPPRRPAAEELRYTEEKTASITDGLETCDADPCAVASELEAAGVNFTAHVVGFGLSSEEGQKVACLAENTGGTYIAAGNAGSARR